MDLLLIVCANVIFPSPLLEPGRKGKAEDGGPGEDEGSPSDCLPCQQGCTFCKDNSPCVALEDGALRLAVLSFQCLCMLIVFISMVLVYHFRRNKVGVILWAQLSTFLFNIPLLYCLFLTFCSFYIL